MGEGDKPRAAFQHTDAAFEQRMGELHIQRLVRFQQVAIVARRCIQPQADMEHQFKAGNLRLYAGLFQDIANAVAQAANFPFCTIEPNVGMVTVPDPRLNVLAKISNSEQILPARVEFVDIAGLVKGASKGEGLGNQFLANIREVDCIVHVVRCFENDDIIHVAGSVDAKELADAGLVVTADPALDHADAVVEADGSVTDLRIATAIERLRDVLA